MPGRIGFLFECGPDGPDVKVCRHLVALMDCDVKFVPATLDNKRNLVAQCGTVARVLLKLAKNLSSSETCILPGVRKDLAYMKAAKMS